MNEVANRYETLDKDLLKKFKTAYTSCQTNLLKSATYAYMLKQTDEVAFVDYAQSELNISRATLSKMLSAGQLMVEKPENIVLPKSYNTVYELTKVSTEIDDFNEFVEVEKETTLEKISVRQAHTFVAEYLRTATDDETDEETTDTTDTETVEENEVLNKLENLLELAKTAKDLYNSNSNFAEANKMMDMIINILEREV